MAITDKNSNALDQEKAQNLDKKNTIKQSVYIQEDEATSKTSNINEKLNNIIPKLRVLLVDDQHSFIVMMRVILTSFGISKIDTANSAEQAIKSCRNNNYDLFLIDYNLGEGLNGRQLIDHLRRSNKIAKESIVFIVTGDNSRPMVLSAIEQEPDDYLIKPFSHAQFRNRLIKAIQKKYALRNVFQAQKEQDTQKEILELKKIVDSNSPYALLCRFMLADCLIKQKNLQEAQATLLEGISISKSPFLQFKLAQVLIMEKKYSEAIPILDEITKKLPFFTEAMKLLASAYELNNQHELAISTIKNAATISPMSVSILTQQIEMAIARKDFLTARDACAALLEVNKNYPNKVENLLGAYTQLEIQFAQSSNDLMHIANIQKHLRSIITRYKKYTNAESFNSNLFNSICEARIQAVKGENIKSKRAMYKAYSSCEQDIQDFSNAILEQMKIGFFQIGEFEVADQINTNIKEKEKLLEKISTPNPKETNEASTVILKTTVDNYLNDQVNIEKRQKYKELNEAGIKAYKRKDLESSLEFFKEALRKLPSNTNALLNKVQVLVDICDQIIKANLLNSKKKYIEKLISEATADLKNITQIPLTQAQKDRTENLNFDIENIKRKLK